MIDAAELARWEKAARKDNPSYWGSDTLVKVFDELRRVEEELGHALAAASIHADEHRKQREHARLKEEQFADVVQRMRRVEDHNRKLEAEMKEMRELVKMAADEFISEHSGD